MITLQLTRTEAAKLETYLLITTKFREGEAEACEKLSAEVDENGNKRFPNSTANAEFWKEQCVLMNSLQKKLYQALTTPEAEGK